MGLKPDEFWSLCPCEFNRWVKAWNQKERQIDRRLAWTQANIMNMWAKRRIRVRDLLPSEQPRAILSKRDFVAEMNRRQRNEELD